MKRSKHIHLVLVTAVLASCNRVMIPADPSAPYVPDATLTMAPAYVDSSANCSCDVYNNYDQYYSPYLSYGYYYHSWYPGSYARRGTVVRSNHFIARGGFGKFGVSAAT
ncbi:hypothetical protein A4D02_27325 [Niastella koreensis]|uniref:Lipoprotein n=2 Tax=Niastella koreensis TaxID=354356 RepID=G8TGV2_NIAKG|nr:hypothetical protein [Niastella koreensis]AEV99554.1 hypothetical protein Niako_3228 [Niastella koreensis GR20-10]OQP50146.1 hypothetical protein A4D02_27325 [Niastella koreensis]